MSSPFRAGSGFGVPGGPGAPGPLAVKSEADSELEIPLMSWWASPMCRAVLMSLGAQASSQDPDLDALVLAQAH